MKVYGELERAQLELLSSDPTPAVEGRIYWHTTEDVAKIDDGAALRTLHHSNFPLTTSGDIKFHNGTAPTRLGIGSAGQILQVSGGLPAWAANPGVTPTYTSKVDNYTVLTTDQNVEIAAATDKAFTMPTAVGNDGFGVNLFAFGAGTHNVATTGGQTVGGLASGVFKLDDEESCRLVSDGANWVVANVLRRPSFSESFGTTQTNYTSTTFATLEGMTFSHVHKGGILMIGFHCVWQNSVVSNGVKHQFRVGGTVIDPAATQLHWDRDDGSRGIATYIGGHDIAPGTYTIDCQVAVITGGTYVAVDEHRKLIAWSLGE